MAVWTRLPFSGSTNGKAITHNSGDPGTTIHTVSTATAIKDQVYLWVHNIATESRELTVQWGGTGSRDYVFYTVPPKDGLYNVIPGLTLVGATDIVVRAFGTATSSFEIFGYVDRAT